MNNLVVDKSRLVWAQITATSSANYPFDTNSAQDISLANIIVYAVEAFVATDVIKTPTGLNVIAAAGAPSVLLTLCDVQGGFLMRDMPVMKLRASQNGGFIVLVADYPVDLSQSYVRVVDSTGLTANYVVPFNLYYKKIA